MKDKLDHFIKEHGLKHWSFAARKDQEFVAWVNEQTKTLPTDLSFAEKVYAAVYNDGPFCHRGNRRKFDSIERGWRFCGRAGSCACAKESVSKKCKDNLSSKSDADWDVIISKRRQTNLDRYGVINAAQTDKAKAAHAAFYDDQENVAKAVAKGQATMLDKYGVKSGFNLPEVNAHRITVAANLSEEAKQSRREKKQSLAKEGRFIRSSHARLKNMFDDLGYEWLTNMDDYTGVYGTGRERFQFRCKTCKLIFDDRIYDGNKPSCPHCYPVIPSYVSKEETAVADFVESLGIKTLRTVRSMLGDGTELDIVLPDINTAIEYCGLYYHSEKSSGKGRMYHQNKLKLCNEHGIRLITIFADEWLLKPDATKNRLRQICGAGSDRIYARKTTCRTISHNEASSFLDEHHLQGAGKPAAIRYGLFSDDRLVAVMTFGSLRRSNNHIAEDGVWELYRFASIGTIVGGASKLFSAFLRDHTPQSVISFCDLRWGTGDVYRHLGFEEESTTKPGYWWVEKYMVRHHRYAFTKHSLVESGYPKAETEESIMFGRGFDRIWDCGNIKFVWKADQSFVKQ